MPVFFFMTSLALAYICLCLPRTLPLPPSSTVDLCPFLAIDATCVKGRSYDRRGMTWFVRDHISQISAYPSNTRYQIHTPSHIPAAEDRSPRSRIPIYRLTAWTRSIGVFYLVAGNRAAPATRRRGFSLSAEPSGLSL
ncbi:hypothetical protein C8Q76DRAFT_185582 [Earliella scabrosa]|nr:hypothetical protein C8Q76DRAFT_185582 [Earliella scabrosa]